MGFFDNPIRERASLIPCDTLTGWTNQARMDLSLAADPLGELGNVLKVTAITSSGAGSFNYTWGSDQNLSNIPNFAIDCFVELPTDVVDSDNITYNSLRWLNNAQSTNMLLFDRPAGVGSISPWSGREGHHYFSFPMSAQVDTGPHNMAATRLLRISWPVVHTLPTTVYIRGIYKNDFYKPAFGVRIDDVRDTGLTWCEDNIIAHYGNKYPLTLAVAGDLTGDAGLASLSRLQDHVNAGTAICFNHTFLHSDLGDADEATILADYEAGRDYLDDNGLTTVRGNIRSSEICILPFGSCDTLARQVLTDAGCKLIVGVNGFGGSHRRHIVGANRNAAGDLGVLDRMIATGTGYQTTAANVTGNIKACADAGEQTLLTFHDIATGATNPTTAVLAQEAWGAVAKRLRANEADWCTPLDWAVAIDQAA